MSSLRTSRSARTIICRDRVKRKRRVLIDTVALLALSRRQDQHHARAVEVAERHLALDPIEGVRVVLIDVVSGTGDLGLRAGDRQR
jgi:hypothetical protein